MTEKKGPTRLQSGGAGAGETITETQAHPSSYQALTGVELAETLDPGSPEWHKAVTASKVGTILGLTPKNWDTAYALWHRMAGIVPVEAIDGPTDAMTRGHEFEPLITKWVREQHPEWTVLETGTWQHHERADHFANPDGIVLLDDGRTGVLEDKTAHDFHLWNGDIPPNYLAQGMWEAYVTGADCIVFAVVGPFEMFDRRPWVKVIDADPAIIAGIVAKADQFMESVASGVAPPRVDAAEPTVEALRWRHPTVEKVPPLDVPDELGKRFVAAYRNKKRVETAIEEARADLIEFMKSAKEAEYDGHIIATRTNRKNSAPSLRIAKGLDVLIETTKEQKHVA